MAFSTNGLRLVGDDGAAYKATVGAHIIGASSPVTLTSGTYILTKKGAGAGLPPIGYAGDAIAVGDIIAVKTGDTITAGTGDELYKLTLSELADVSNIEMEFSKEEIDVSVLRDAVKMYVAGKGDMKGTMDGVFIQDTTDKTDGFIRQFLPLVKQDGDTSFDRFDQAESIILAILFINEKSEKGDQMAVIAGIQLFGEKLGGAMGSAQSFSSGFRFAPLAIQGVNVVPTLYRWSGTEKLS